MANEHELLEKVWQLLTDVTNTLVQEKLELLKRYISLEDEYKACRKEAEKPSLLTKPSDEINPPITPTKGVLSANEHFDQFPDPPKQPKQQLNDLPWPPEEDGLIKPKTTKPQTPIDDPDCPF